MGFSITVRDDQHELAVELARLNLLEDAGAFPGVGADPSVLPGGNTAGDVRKGWICVEIHKACFGNNRPHCLAGLPDDAVIPVRNKSHLVAQPGPAFDGDGVHAGFAAKAAAVGGQGTAYAVGVVDPAAFVVLSDFGKSRWTCLVESKYFSGTSVSKISDNVHPIAGLGDAEILAVKHLPRDIVPQLIQRAEDGRKRPALVMR